jgi:hypothetical protein
LGQQKAVVYLKLALLRTHRLHNVSYTLVSAATHLLSGAMNEAVLWVARAAEPQQALDEAFVVLEQLLAGLRSCRTA